jgi:type I restriction enzyme S subunit
MSIKEILLKDIFSKPISGEWGDEPDENDFVKIIKTNNILNTGHINYNNITLRKIDHKAVELKKLQYGDILIEKSGGSPANPVGRVCFFEKENEVFLTNNFMSTLRVSNEQFYHRYVFYAMSFLYKKRVVLNFQNQTTGIINLKLDRYLSTIKIKQVDLTKQIEIAKALHKAQELIALRKASIEKLDELAQSIFIDMFGDPVSNPKKWDIKEIRDLILEAKYGTSEKSSEEIKEYAVLRMNNLTYSGCLDLTSLKYMDLEEKEREKYLVKKGDLLFNRTNSKELVGKTAVYNREEPMAFAGYLIRVRCEDLATNVYISAFLNSKVGKKLLTNMCKSIVGMANINAQELQNIKIAHPPLKLQQEFAQTIEKIESQKSLYEAELTKLQESFDALMAQSFEG